MNDKKPFRSNCHICGKFVGKNGNHDISSNSDGQLEQGYPTCEQHTKKRNNNVI